MTQGSDNRQYKRIPVDLTVNVRGPQVYTMVKGKNISVGGIFLEAADLEPEGTPVVLDFALDDHTSLLNIKGEVMWLRPYHIEGEDGHYYPSGMGIRFIDIPLDAVCAIEEHMADLPFEL